MCFCAKTEKKEGNVKWRREGEINSTVGRDEGKGRDKT